MKKMHALMLSLLLGANSLSSDFSSLTNAELSRMKKANEQAAYYVVYEDLRTGKDTFTVDKIEKVSEAYIGEYKFVTQFRYHVTITAGGIPFKRTFTIENMTQLDTGVICDKPSTLRTVLETTGKVALGVGLGWLAASASCGK